MEIFQVVGIGLIGTVLAVFVKERNKEVALLVSLCTGLIIFSFAIAKVGAVIEVLGKMAGNAGVNFYYLETMLKIIGISYVAEFGAQVCRDAGEGATATKVEFAAKVLVMVVALPIFVAVLESILRLIP